LPIKIHTKFIENHKNIIDELLEFIDKQEELWIIQPLIEKNLKLLFEQKYNLKIKPNFIRFRYLDKNLQTKFLWTKIDDIYLKIQDFEQIDIKCNKVFIVENEINYLTFPEIKNSIIIWWKWFNISNIKNIEWLNKKEILYWWDLDSHGFKILVQCRKYFKHTKSLFMDKEVYDKYKQYIVKWKILSKEEEKNLEKFLTKQEFSLFEYLNQNKKRLEQENVSQEYVLNLI